MDVQKSENDEALQAENKALRVEQQRQMAKREAEEKKREAEEKRERREEEDRAWERHEKELQYKLKALEITANAGAGQKHEKSLAEKVEYMKEQLGIPPSTNMQNAVEIAQTTLGIRCSGSIAQQVDAVIKQLT